jgi:hypothetical protein
MQLSIMNCECPANVSGSRLRRTETNEKAPVSESAVSDILSIRLSHGAFFFFAPQKRGEMLINVKLIFFRLPTKTRET